MLTGWRRTFTVIYWAVAVFVLVVGWAASRFLVPGIIESAYAGHSFAFLNSIISGQDDIPLSRYLAAWTPLANRLLAGAVFAAVAGYAIVLWHAPPLRFIRRCLLEPAPRRPVPSALVYLGIFVGLTAGAAEALAVLSGIAYPPWPYSSEVLWMAPAAGAMVFGVLGTVLAFITLRWPAFPRFEVAVGALSAVAAYGVIRPVFSSVHPLAAAVLSLGVAVQAARLSGGRAWKFHPWLRRWAGRLSGLVVAVALVQHGGSWILERRSLATLPQSSEGAPNILLLILDTVRAKNLSLYGYGRPTTPVLDALATNAVVFDRAFAPSSWTLPSHATFFTGRWPSELNVDFLTPLDDVYPTIAEFVTEHGYVPAGFVANYAYTDSRSGLDRGFLHYEDEPVSWLTLARNSWLIRTLVTEMRTWPGWHDSYHRKSATQVTADFLAWRRKTPERPYFAFLNYWDAHSPYRPPPPFRNAFADGDGQYWNTGVRTDEVAGEVQAAYDGGIAYIDHEIGVLLAELERRGELDNTLVIVTSDHGEHFGEHGLLGHGNSLYLPSIHVPLLLRLPFDASGGTRVAQPVSLRDLAATIVDVAGLGETAPFPGTSLKSQWGPRQDVPSYSGSPVVAQLIPLLPDNQEEDRFSSDALASILVGDKYYIAWEDGREELYDLANDPDELNDLSGTAENDLRELREILSTFP